MGRIAFDCGESLGTSGSEGGTIRRDKEHNLGARITLEEGGSVRPGISGPRTKGGSAAGITHTLKCMDEMFIVLPKLLLARAQRRAAELGLSAVQDYVAELIRKDTAGRPGKLPHYLVPIGRREAGGDPSRSAPSVNGCWTACSPI
jgi:hypothetical protein